MKFIAVMLLGLLLGCQTQPQYAIEKPKPETMMQVSIEYSTRNAIEGGYGAGVDKNILLAVCEQESGCEQYSDGLVLIGSHGEIGAMQIYKDNWKACGGKEAIMFPVQNIQCGAMLLGDAINKYGLERGLMFYHRGPRAFGKYQKEARRYARQVMSRVNAR